MRRGKSVGIVTIFVDRLALATRSVTGEIDRSGAGRSTPDPLLPRLHTLKMA
jgi:hypothetical protein